ASQESYRRCRCRQRTECEEGCRRPGSCLIQRYDQGRYRQPQGAQWKQPTSNQEICQGKQQRHHHIRDSIRLSFQQGLEVWCREGRLPTTKGPIWSCQAGKEGSQACREESCCSQ
ncbi:hypothetical protein LTR40_012445, partial [Exophiala xenobiotica]